MNSIDRIAYIHRVLYFYRKRSDSITARMFSVCNYDLLDVISYIISDARKRHPDAYRRLKIGYANYYLAFLNKAYLSDALVQDEEEQLRDHVRNNAIGVLGSTCLGGSRRILLLIFGCSPFFYKKIVVPIIKSLKYLFQR